jgi:hypothetical protein
VALFAVRLHMGQEDLQAVNKPLEVDADDPVPVGRGNLFDRPRAGYAGIVAEDVDVAERRKGFCRGLGERVTIRHVASQADDPHSFAAKRFDGLRTSRRFEGGDCDVHAAVSEGPAQRQADTACAAGDEGGFSFKSIHRTLTLA